jgi:hypothetical protein
MTLAIGINPGQDKDSNHDDEDDGGSDGDDNSSDENDPSVWYFICNNRNIHSPLAPPPLSPTWYPLPSLSPHSSPLPASTPLPAPTVNADTTLPPPAHSALTTSLTIPDPLPQLSLQTRVLTTHALKTAIPQLESSGRAPESSIQPSDLTKDLTMHTPESLAKSTAPRTALQGLPATVSPMSKSLIPLPLKPLHTVTSPEPGPELAVSVRGWRLRKAIVLSLNMCMCGVTITDSEINIGENIMKCQVPGCKTVLVCCVFPFYSSCTALSCAHTLSSFIKHVWTINLHPDLGCVIVVQVVLIVVIICSASVGGALIKMFMRNSLKNICM